MMTLFFCDGPVRNYTDAKRADTAAFGRFFQGMRERGVFLPPSQFEAMFLSLAHGETEIDDIIRAAREVLSNR